MEDLFKQQLEQNQPLTKERLDEANKKKEELMQQYPEEGMSYIDENRVGKIMLYYMVFRDETDEEFNQFKTQVEKDGITPPEGKGAICEMKMIWNDELDELSAAVDNQELEFFDIATGSNDFQIPRFKRSDMEFDMSIRNIQESS